MRKLLSTFQRELRYGYSQKRNPWRLRPGVSKP
jgi:hypothetical protein